MKGGKDVEETEDNAAKLRSAAAAEAAWDQHQAETDNTTTEED